MLTETPPLPENEEARLSAVRRLRLLESPGDDVFDDFTALAAFVCATPIALITMIDRERQRFLARRGLEIDQTPREHAFCAHAILQDDILEVPDAHDDARFRRNPLVTGDPNIRFYAGATLKTPDGHSLGTLCVIDRQPRALTGAQRTALRALKRQIEAQFALRQALAELATLQKAREHFVATVSHELRTPLTSLHGSLALLSDGGAGELPDEARELTDLAARNAKRLLLLVNDILDYEQMVVGGGLRMTPSATPVSAIFARAGEVVQGMAAAHRVTVRFADAGERVVGDLDRLVQVLANLVSNAIKFSPVQGTVHVAAARTGGLVRIDVDDEGPGVPESQRAAVFEPFRQVEGSAAHKKPGTGLGLAITRRIVEAHGGEIGIANREDARGARFFFTVPAAP